MKKITKNTTFKTLAHLWLQEKQTLVTQSTYAGFLLIIENHLITYFGVQKICDITEPKIQEFIFYLFNKGRLDNTGGLTVKTIRDIILVLRLTLNFAYKARVINALNWDLIEYPKDLKIKKVISLSKDEEQMLIQAIYLNLTRKSVGILLTLFTGLRIGELCGLQMLDISLCDNTISVNKTVQRIYNKSKKTSYIHIGVPKTESSQRTIPVPSLLMNIIKILIISFFLNGFVMKFSK